MGTEPNPAPSINNSGAESWVREAIAQQEEYLKRRRPCEDVAFREHHFVDFGHRLPDGAIAMSATWRECLACGVTETDDDYQRKIATRDDS